MRKYVGSFALLLAFSYAAVNGPATLSAQTKSTTTTQKAKAAPTSVFELYKDKGGEYRFRLNDADGNLLASAGKGYKEKADALKVIDTIKADAAKAKVDDQTAAATK